MSLTVRGIVNKQLEISIQMVYQNTTNKGRNKLSLKFESNVMTPNIRLMKYKGAYKVYVSSLEF